MLSLLSRCMSMTLTFDLGSNWTKVSNCTSTHDGEQLCKFTLKSIQNCRSYGLDKNLTWTNFQLAHLQVMENNCANPKLQENSTFKCDLDLGPTWPNVSMAHLLVMENNCAKSFWNPSTIVEVMVQTNLDGWKHACRHGHTHIHWTKQKWDLSK